MSKDVYYDRHEVSNSDLSELNKLLNPDIFSFDFEQALRFGSLVDAMITESHRVNVYKRSLDDEIYLQSDFDRAKLMKQAFYRDATCAAFMRLADCQKVSVGMVEYEWNAFKFWLECRSKWDIWMPSRFWSFSSD